MYLNQHGLKISGGKVALVPRVVQYARDDHSFTSRETQENKWVRAQATRSGIGWLCWTMLPGYVCSRYGCPTSKHVVLLYICVWNKHYLVAITSGCIKENAWYLYIKVWRRGGEGVIQNFWLIKGGAITKFTPLDSLCTAVPLPSKKIEGSGTAVHRLSFRRRVLPNNFLLEAHFPTQYLLHSPLMHRQWSRGEGGAAAAVDLSRSVEIPYCETPVMLARYHWLTCNQEAHPLQA